MANIFIIVLVIFHSFSFNYLNNLFVSNVEVWTVGRTQQGLWVTVTALLSIFTIFTKQTINRLMEKIISTLTYIENNQIVQMRTTAVKSCFYTNA